ncbi:hypothetical protein [Phenylobacterium aquaticum]|uniref:hypothetical protein n=1 Tax=Phenylobacterium aquaticum TaxID=1763816 RepID=UPI0026F1D85A|nr:hypothetical protein [Phenylobacterium aquaticum]
MRAIIEPPPEPGTPPDPLWRRLAWFAALGVAGTATAATLAWVMKALLPAT